MEENKILDDDGVMNEESEETTEVVTEESSGKGLAVAIGIGVTALVGGLVYRFVAKPLIAKYKARKEQKKYSEVESEEPVVEYDDVDNLDEAVKNQK